MQHLERLARTGHRVGALRHHGPETSACCGWPQRRHRRLGFDVHISPFAARPSSNVKTLTAAVRE
jgi:hypothetical protein